MPYKKQSDLTLYIREWRAKRKQKALEYLGNKCSTCGSTENLEFDHIIREGKFKNIGRLWTASGAIFWNEVRKCQLLCKECHREKTNAENSRTSLTGVRGSL